MNLKHYRIKEENGKIKIYKRLINPYEIIEHIINLVVGVLFIDLALLLTIGIYNAEHFDKLTVVILVALNLLILYLIYWVLPPIYKKTRRILKPILVIHQNRIFIRSHTGALIIESIANVRSIHATLLKGTSHFWFAPYHLRTIYFSKIIMTTKQGKQLYFDSIPSSKISRPLIEEVAKELKNDSKLIGSYLSKQLNTQYYWSKAIE